MGSPTRIALLVLIWRTCGALSYRCRSTDTIKYFPTPLPVYKISRFVNASAYKCISHDNPLDAYTYSKSPNVTQNNVTLEQYLLPEIIAECWFRYRCDLPIPKTQSAFYNCSEDNTRIITLETNYLIIAADEFKVAKYKCSSDGFCFTFEAKENIVYAWKESKNYLKFDQCDEKPVQETEFSWIGNTSRYIVIHNNLTTTCLKLGEKFSRCGMDFWLTSQEGIVVSNLKEPNRQHPPIDIIGKKEKNDVFFWGSKRGPPESQTILDKNPLLCLVILWYIAGTLFNIVVNYLTLRKVAKKKKQPSRKYLLYCLTQSLTNRYLYLDQEGLYDTVSSSAPTPGNTDNNYNNRNDSGNEYDSGGYLKPKAMAEHCASDERFNSKPGNEYSYVYMHPKRGIDF